jgi:hypothetical protein
MKPVRFKMATGAFYVGFPGEIDSYGMFPLLGSCTVSFISKENRFDVRGIMTSIVPIYVNLASVQARQELVDTTDVTLAYCRYLGTLIASMEEDGHEIPEVFQSYVKYIDPYFKTQFDGVPLMLAGQYECARAFGNVQLAESLSKEMIRASKSYHGVTEPQSTCKENVVHIQFGSKHHAPEEG